MSSLIDLVVATGMFFVFVALIISFVLAYYSNFLGVLQDSELRTTGANVQNIFFGGKGVPQDWETRNTTPARIGLINDLFRKAVVLTTTNTTDLNNVTLNLTVNFDAPCQNTTRENTIRIYNETNGEHPYTLYNKSFCVANTFLRSADVAINVTIPALTSKTFFVYFSPESGINLTNYGTVAFPANVTNYTAIVYPAEKLSMVSPSKLRALRNLTYTQVAETLGSNTRFEVEVDRP